MYGGGAITPLRFKLMRCQLPLTLSLSRFFFFFFYSLVQFLFSSSSYKSNSPSHHLSFSVPVSSSLALFLLSIFSCYLRLSLCSLCLSFCLSLPPLSFPQARPRAFSTHIRHCTKLAVRQREKDWLAVV